MKNYKPLKYISFLIIIVVTFLLGVSFGGKYEIKKDILTKNYPNGTASLMIDYGNSKIKTYLEVKLPDTQTNLFELLKLVTKENKIELANLLK